MREIIYLKFCNILIAIFFLGSASVAISKTLYSFAEDTVSPIPIHSAIDSSKIEQGTAKLSTPLSQHGSFFLRHYNSKSITKHNLLFEKYLLLSDIIENQTNSYSFRLNAFLNYNSFSFLGGQPDNLSLRFNSRPISDYQTNIPLLDIFPCEFLEKIEIFTGSDAGILGGSSSALINIQEIKYNTKTPYTRLWYAQAGYDFISADGVFTQNILPNSNFAFGFRRLGAKGKYDNSWNDLWNLRELIRWNPNNETSISLVHIFTNAGIGLNGGVDYVNSTNYFNEYDAYVNYEDFNERRFQHDLTLSISKNISTYNSLSASIYYSHKDFGRYLPKYLLQDTTLPAGVYSQFSYDYGIIAKSENELSKNITLRLGGEFIYSKFPTSFFTNNYYTKKTFAGFVHSTFNLTKTLLISGGARLQNENSNSLLYFGGKLCYNIVPNLTTILDYSYSEQTGRTADNLQNHREKHNLLSFLVMYDSPKFKAEANFFYRNIKEPILYKPVYDESLKIISTTANITNSRTILGFQFSTELVALSNFHPKLKLQLNKCLLDEEKDGILPDLYSTFDLHYEFKRGASILHIGFELELWINYQGYQFIPVNKTYIAYKNKKDIMWNGLRPYAIAKLGNAHLRVEFENVFSAGYYYVPIYASNDRNFRLMLSWFFND